MNHTRKISEITWNCTRTIPEPPQSHTKTAWRCHPNCIVRAWHQNYLGIKSCHVAGVTGAPGSTGAKGARGPPGLCADNPEKDGFLFSRHSQNVQVPECPPGSVKVYSGFSLLFINGNNRAHGQDLGTWHYTRKHPTRGSPRRVWKVCAAIDGTLAVFSGALGSCLPRFTTMPFLFCNTDSTCRYAARNDYSYWLSTEQSGVSTTPFISGPLLKNYISR